MSKLCPLRLDENYRAGMHFCVEEDCMAYDKETGFCFLIHKPIYIMNLKETNNESIRNSTKGKKSLL